MSESAAYPKRRPFFAHRFIRLMARTCLGARIGPDSCWLLTIIAMTEDAKKYSGTVYFFAANLADQCGFSISSMERARKRATEAGWLHHEPGAKGRASGYWVIIPPEESAKPDGPSDEEPVDILRQVDGVSGEHVTDKDRDGDFSVKLMENLTEQAVSIRGVSDGVSGEHVTDIHTYPSPEDSSEPTSSASEPIAASPLLIFPTVGKDGNTWPLFSPMVDEWSALYPGVDVLSECRKALAWTKANMEKRKTARGMPRFLVNWINREQNRGGKSGLIATAHRSGTNPRPGYDIASGSAVAPPMVLNGKAGGP